MRAANGTTKGRTRDVPSAMTRPDAVEPQPQQPRTVIYAGPPKTGSTSIQNFFYRYASSKFADSKLRAFEEWDMPPGNYQLCRHFGGYNNATVEEMVRIRMERVLKQQDKRIRAHERPWNLFWACEFIATSLPRFGPQRLTNVFQWLKMLPADTEFVFHYRTPRVEQFLSSWQQLTGAHHPERHGMSLRDFACTQRASVDRLAEFDLNPLAGIKMMLDLSEMTLHRNEVTDDFKTDFKFSIVDMSGVERDGQDVVQHLACDVLGVACDQDGKVVGSPASNRSNTRPRDETILTSHQRESLEALFRNRDCLYQRGFQNDTRLTIEHQDTLWQDCPTDVEPFLRLNTTATFVQNIREILECPSDDAIGMFGDMGNVEVPSLRIAQFGSIVAILYMMLVRKLRR